MSAKTSRTSWCGCSSRPISTCPRPSGVSFTSTKSTRSPASPRTRACAFDGLEKIIESRTGRRQIGFTKEEVAEGVAAKLKKNPFVDVEPDDLLRYGLIPELVGRLPVTVPLDALDEDALIRILTEPKNALAKQYQKLFDLEDVRLTLEKDALKAIAAKAMKRGTGARGLRAILEEMMTEIMFELPSRDDVREVAITAECVTSGRAPLLVTERPRQKKEA